MNVHKLIGCMCAREGVQKELEVPLFISSEAKLYADLEI